MYLHIYLHRKLLRPVITTTKKTIKSDRNKNSLNIARKYTKIFCRSTTIIWYKNLAKYSEVLVINFQVKHVFGQQISADHVLLQEFRTFQFL